MDFNESAQRFCVKDILHQIRRILLCSLPGVPQNLQCHTVQPVLMLCHQFIQQTTIDGIQNGHQCEKKPGCRPPLCRNSFDRLHVTHLKN